MVDALKKRNLDPYSDSRPLEPEDFQKFDYIINMNHENVQEVQKAAQYWKDDLQKPLPSNWKDKVTGQHPYDCNLHMHDHSRYLESVCIMFTTGQPQFCSKLSPAHLAFTFLRFGSCMTDTRHNRAPQCPISFCLSPSVVVSSNSS